MYRSIRLGTLALLSIAVATGQTAVSSTAPRTLQDIARSLEAKLGWLITYEDPPFENPSELIESVSASYRATHPNASFVVPRPKAMNISVNVPVISGPASESANLDLIGPAIDSVVKVANSSSGTRFASRQVGDYSHITPAVLLKKDGSMVPAVSLLDTLVTLPSAERTIGEAVDLICAQVATSRHFPIIIGAVPSNLFYGRKQVIAANQESARDVLIRIFKTADQELIDNGFQSSRITWDLLYDVNEHAYYFNAHGVTGPMRPGQLR